MAHTSEAGEAGGTDGAGGAGGAPLFVGIDVSERRLDVALRRAGATQRAWQVDYDAEGLDQLVDELSALQPERIALEAPGGLERELALALSAAGLPAAVLNPRLARQFARAAGRLAKTDAIDAALLAHHAEALRPTPHAPRDDATGTLRALLMRRRQLVELRKADTLRLRRAHPAQRPSLEAHLAWLEAGPKQLDAQLDEQLQSQPRWREQDALLRSVPGVGPGLSRTLLAAAPELGQLGRKPIAALIGVAPLNNDSGQRSGQRGVWGGRAMIRSALYMAALSATRCNPVIQAFYQRLTKAGKPKKTRPRRLHAQAAHNPQRDPQERPTLATPQNRLTSHHSCSEGGGGVRNVAVV